MKMMQNIKIGCSVGDKELFSRRDEIEIGDNRDPLPEILMTVKVPANECTFLEALGQ